MDSETRMEVTARNAVLSSGHWLTAAEVSKLAGFGSCDENEQLYQWKSQGQIFSIENNGLDYYPSFALNTHDGYRPLASLAEIIAIFADEKSGWGMAFWFQSVNSYLGGLKPLDVLSSDPDSVIRAALDEAEGITHG